MAKFKANNNKKKKKIFVSPKQITVVPAGAKLEELEIPKTRLTRAGEPTPKFFKKHPLIKKAIAGVVAFGKKTKEEFKVAKEKAIELKEKAKEEKEKVGKILKEGREAVRGGAEIVRKGAREVAKFYEEGRKEEERERRETEKLFKGESMLSQIARENRQLQKLAEEDLDINDDVAFAQDRRELAREEAELLKDKRELRREEAELRRDERTVARDTRAIERETRGLMRNRGGNEVSESRALYREAERDRKQTIKDNAQLRKELKAVTRDL